MKRRSFLRNSSLALLAAGTTQSARAAVKSSKEGPGPTLALNAYSFTRPLRNGSMSLDELFDYTRKTGFPALDLTAYYIPDYPEVPDDEVLYEIRNKAFLNGLSLSGTGVRNDFTLEDPDQLSGQLQLVKNWIKAASKLGVPHVRVFDGKGEGLTGPRKKTIRQVIRSFQECADYAADYGVMITFQNHHEYIKSTEEVLEVLQSVKSPWFGLMLDIGSVIGPDPYKEIERLIPYAVSWQVKENVRVPGGRKATNFNRLIPMVIDSGYRGFFPLETLGEGDPKEKVANLYQEVTGIFAGL